MSREFFNAFWIFNFYNFFILRFYDGAFMTKYDELLSELLTVEKLLQEYCLKHDPDFKEKALLLMRKTFEVVAEMPDYDSNQLDLLNEI